MRKNKAFTIEQLKRKVAKFRNKRGWKDNPKNLAMAVAVEAAELMELFQWKSLKEAEEMGKNAEELKKIKDELADVVIYCLSFADKFGINLGEAVMRKLEKNRKKYPVKK